MGPGDCLVRPVRLVHAGRQAGPGLVAVVGETVAVGPRGGRHCELPNERDTKKFCFCADSVASQTGSLQPMQLQYFLSHSRANVVGATLLKYTIRLD